MSYVQGECCSDWTQDQKNVLPEIKKYKVQKFNIIKKKTADHVLT